MPDLDLSSLQRPCTCRALAVASLAAARELRGLMGSYDGADTKSRPLEEAIDAAEDVAESMQRVMRKGS